MSGSNQVDIDAAALAAEAASVELPAGEAPAGQPQAADITPPGETLQDIEARARRDWLGGMQFAVQGFAHIASGWNLLPEECDVLALDMSMAAAAWFPDGQLPAKYLVLLNLGGHAFAIVAARRDPATGKVRALRAPSADQVVTEKVARGIAHAAEEVQAGAFTTSA